MNESERIVARKEAWGNSFKQRKKSPIEKFWEKVNKNGRQMPHVLHLGNCWEWKAGKFVSGHGQWENNFFPERRSHRVSWFIHFGEIPSDIFVCHKCDNPACVRPDHLFLGTALDNIKDMDLKGRRKTVARKGELCGMSKLTEHDVLEIREMIKNGNTQWCVANHFGIKQSTVWSIKERKTWTHI